MGIQWSWNCIVFGGKFWSRDNFELDYIFISPVVVFSRRKLFAYFFAYIFIFANFKILSPKNSDAFFPFGDVSIIAGSEPHAEQVDAVTGKNEDLKKMKCCLAR